MGWIGLIEALKEEEQKVKTRLNITDDKLFEDFCNLIARHYNSFTNDELDVLCRVFSGEPRQE